MGNLNFDASGIAPTTAFDPLPDGWYAMRIIESDMAPSEKAGDMLKLRLEIDESAHPEFANRSVFDRLCLNHPTSSQAREIAQRTLSAICHSIGKLQISDTEELLGQSLRVKVKAMPARTDPANGKSYEASNEVKGYKALSEKVEASPPPSTTPTAKAAATTAPAATRSAVPSWKKNPQQGS
jgi:hypothetical protein